MASDTFKTLAVGLIVFVLFSSLIIAIAVDFGADHGKSAEDIGGGSLDLSVFQKSIENVSQSTSAYRQRFEGGDVDDIDDASGVFSVVTDMISLITTPFRLLSQVLTNIFNVPASFINVVLGVLSIILILSIWSLVKKGD